MNDEDFEKKLAALTGAIPRPDPTLRWKADILARARREADAGAGTGAATADAAGKNPDATPPARRLLPPRWLMATWGAAWVLIVGMNLSMPRTGGQAGSSASTTATAVTPPAELKPRPPADSQAGSLIAYQSHLNLYLQLP